MVFLLEKTKVDPKHEGDEEKKRGEKYYFVGVGHGDLEKGLRRKVTASQSHKVTGLQNYKNLLLLCTLLLN